MKLSTPMNSATTRLVVFDRCKVKVLYVNPVAGT